MNGKSPPRMARQQIRRQQTTRINGKRVKIVITDTGTTVTDAAPLEWELQAAGVRALRAMPEYGKAFTLAGDFNAGRRGQLESTKAKATGLTSGEADLRVYLANGCLGQIEYKTTTGRLSAAQKGRHALMAGLGHVVEVIRAATTTECAERTVALVRGWLAANDNLPDAKIPC